MEPWALLFVTAAELEPTFEERFLKTFSRKCVETAIAIFTAKSIFASIDSVVEIIENEYRK